MKPRHFRVTIFLISCVSIGLPNFSKAQSANANEIAIVNDSSSYIDIPNEVKQLDVALVEKNYEALQNLLHDDLQMVHSNAVIQTKQQVIADLQSRRIEYDSITCSKFRFVDKKKKYLKLNRIIVVKGKYESYDFDVKLTVLEVWKKERGEWKLWARQATKMNN